MEQFSPKDQRQGEQSQEEKPAETPDRRKETKKQAATTELTGPDPDTPLGFPGWSHLVEFHCTIPRECTKGPHLKEM